MNPQTQLAAFAERGDERVFRRLVESYSSLVYGIALRKTGSPQTAEEITQNVFLIVARKAKALSKREGFVAWLHRTTAYEANNFLRAETHRKRTMKRYQLDQEREATEKQCRSDAVREAVDDAIASLSAGDRLAILYRFFEGRDFKEIGTLLGKSDAAVQKQTRRALEKLSVILRKRGVVASVSVVTALMTSEFAKSAPTSLVSAIVRQAANQSATNSLLTTTAIAMSAHKTLVLAAVILIVGLFPLARQQARIQERASERDRLLARTKSVPASSGLTLRRSSPGSQRWRPPAAEAVDATVLVRAFLKDMGKLGSMRLTGIGLKEAGDGLAPLSDDELWALFEQIDAEPAGSDVRQEVKEYLVLYHLSRRDPAQALEAALEHRMREEVFVQVMRDWANTDIEAASPWLSAQQEMDRLGLQRLDGAAPETALWRGLVEGIAMTHPDRALTFVRDQLDSANAAALVTGLGRSLLAEDNHQTYLDLARALPSPEEHVHALSNYATTILTDFADPARVHEAMNAFLHHPEFPAMEREAVFLSTANELAFAIHRGSIDRTSMLPWMMIRGSTVDEVAMLNLSGESPEKTRERLSMMLSRTFSESTGEDTARFDGPARSAKQ